MGDSSDNISGVAGIGEKTALALIKEFGNIENLYNNYENASLTNSVKTKLSSGKDAAFQSKWLATIALDAPISSDVNEYKISEPDSNEVRKILSDLEMFKLLERLNLEKATGFVQTELTVEDKAPKKEYKILQLEKIALEKIISSNAEIDFIFDGENLKLCHDDTIYITSDEKIILAFLETKNSKRTFDAKIAYKLAFS